MLKVIVLSLAFSSYANADVVTDFISNLYVNTRASTNQTLSKVASWASCSTLVARQELRQCEEGPAKNQQVNALAAQLKKIELHSREKQFLARAHQDQRNAIECEIKQLRALYNEESVKPFYGHVINDLCHKLDELRKRAATISSLTSKLNSYKSKYSHGVQASNHRFPISNAEANKLLVQISKYERLLKREEALYFSVRTSVWRSGHPVMESYINSAMRDKSNSICKGAHKDYKSYFPERKKFQDNVIYKMIRSAQDDLTALGKSPNNLSIRGIQILMGRSNWKNYLKGSKTRRSKLEDAVMMCDLEQKYTKGNELTQSVLNAASWGLWGVGGVLKVGKFASVLSKGETPGILANSNLWLFASSFPTVAFPVNRVVDSCMGPNHKRVLNAPNCPLTSTGNVDMKKMVNVEIQDLRQTNCALDLAIGSATVVPTLGGFLKTFRGIAKPQ